MIKTEIVKDDKLKPLSPSLRQKKRFIKIKINSKNKFNFSYLSKELTDKLIYYMGAIDLSNGGVWFLKDKFNLENQELIIRVSTKLKDKFLASLLLIENLQNEKIKIEIIKVSGTLKGM
jgi:RNase P/RNase MRP subunit POP5